MSTFFAWIMTILLSFGAGASVGHEYQEDTELEQKVQAHMDVIVDEAAGIVDDVSASAKERRAQAESEFKDSDAYKEAEEFAGDVEEIVNNTKEDIDAHFGDETETETEALAETETALEVVDA